MRVNANQCMYGLKSHDGEREGPARSGTGFLTNSVCIADQLRIRCPNRRAHQAHRHVVLTNGRAHAAQTYPDGLCRAICQGLRAQMQMDAKGKFLLMNVNIEEGESSQELQKSAEKLKHKYRIVEEDNEEQIEAAWDDVSGAELNPRMVEEARKEEIEYVRKMRLCDKVHIAERKRVTGNMPTTVRWIDINKGDSNNPHYRSIIVARELNTHKRDDLFAATPPLEALKIILSMVAIANKGEVVMINDISREFFHAKVERDVYVALPDEDRGPGEEHLCGNLRFSMYGTRDAPQNRYKEHSQQLVKMGFIQGIASPCTFYHHARQIRTYVHGDDYVSIGLPGNLQWVKNELEKKYQVKTQVLGPGEGQQRQVKILNRIVTWDNQRGLVYEADPRHAEIAIKHLKLKDAKEVSTPGTREEGHTTEDHDDKLSEKEATKYKAIVTRFNYITPDRPYLAYAIKELARAMSSPSNGDWLRLKRVGRYLKGRPRVQQVYELQPRHEMVVIYSDADWAGCSQTRRSTTGGCITVGKHTIKGWSKTQALVAPSSGESELYAVLKAAAETLGLMSMLKDLNWKMTGQVYGDASAALGIINRTGLGKTRHIDISLLWIQQTAAEGQLTLVKFWARTTLPTCTAST